MKAYTIPDEGGVCGVGRKGLVCVSTKNDSQLYGVVRVCAGQNSILQDKIGDVREVARLEVRGAVVHDGENLDVDEIVACK